MSHGVTPGRPTGAPGPESANVVPEQLSLQLEQLILGAERQYTPFQAARAADVPMELASKFWRAMGFADIGESRALTEADVIALRRLGGLVESGLLSESMAVQVARSTGQTTSRLAEWQIDTMLEALVEAQEPGMNRAEMAHPLMQLLLPEFEQFLVYVWRRQLAAATGRVVQGDDQDAVHRRLAVGFADLVGFTRLSRRMEEEELGELVEAFETTAADIVAANGGRLVKTLGDEVLFVADDPATAAEVGLRLVESMSDDETMPALRVGMAFGAVTARMGDVFGTTVNLASRMTSIAPRDSVLLDGEMVQALERAAVVPPSEPSAEAAAAEQHGDASPGAGSDGYGAAEGPAGLEPTPEPEARPASEYRYRLQPMWRRPVRGLGTVEPWLLSRRQRPA